MRWFRSAISRSGAPYLRCTAALAALAALSGCMSLERTSHDLNPLGWPAKSLAAGGIAAIDSEVPLYRETGQTARALGDLLESPALLVEGVLTADAPKLLGSGEKLLAGAGGALTSLLNLPAFFMTGGTIDLGRESRLVNDALAYMETVEHESWCASCDGDCEPIYPPGTRVRASGRHLVWTLPGEGRVVQAAEVSPALALGLGITGMAHVAQARTWGFVVGSRAKWEDCGEELRAVIIIHEFYHQHVQIRRMFRGWSVLYWPAYLLGLSGDREHWAEMGRPLGAYAVNRALRDWHAQSAWVGKDEQPVLQEATDGSDLISPVGAERRERRRVP